MYSVKGSGRNGYASYTTHMHQELEAASRFQTDARKAIEEGTLDLHVQPLVTACGGRFEGAEALLRWHHPERGAVRPDLLVAAAEEIGLWHMLQTWVLRRGCAILRDWQARPALAGATLAINISPTYLQHDGFVEHVVRILREERARPDRLVLEVTEHSVLDDIEDVAGKMVELRRHGVRFALDDFGTGYSSLTYLKRLPLDDVKIDRSFVRDLKTDAGDRAIIEAIIAVAQQLGLGVTAEGVEDLSQAVHLNSKGCTKLQGFLFSKAMPNERLVAWMEETGRTAPATAEDVLVA